MSKKEALVISCLIVAAAISVETQLWYAATVFGLLTIVLAIKYI